MAPDDQQPSSDTLEPLEAIDFELLSIEEVQAYFPQYKIQSFIAEGGMGAVYSATQNSLERSIAIKILPAELSAHTEYSAQFRAEADLMSRINHPNLIALYEFGEVHDILYIVMELVTGKSLHHSAHQSAIDQSVALDLVIALTEGVDHMHKMGILHRDIKPGNILLDTNGSPKLGDFGLARSLTESEVGKTIFGTPGYTAPEVVDNTELIDERSDIYSLGVILYELLTGSLPDLQSYISPSQVGLAIDSGFDDVVNRAIAAEPHNRYHGAQEFLSKLYALKVLEPNE